MADQTTLRATFVSESAAYRNTFGWYNTVTGVGGILFGSIEAEGSQRTVVGGQSYVDFTVNTADVGNIQFFLIADGGNLNADQPDDLTGAIKVIQLADGTWAVADVDANGNVIYKNGKPDLLAGAGVNAMFTETSKNAGGVDYASSYVGTQQTATRLAGDTADGATGLIAWEDLAATKKGNKYSAPGDADYNDAVFQISVVTSNRPPVANADIATVGEDAGATTINVLANDTDPDGNALRVTAVSTTGVLGTVTIAANGQGVIYTPAASFQSLAAGQTATETFTYTVSDQNGGTATATTTVTITGANDAPVVSGPVTGTATEGGTVSTLNALAKAADVDNGTILSVVLSSPLPAGVTYNAAAKTFSLNPTDAAYNSLAANATATVTVTYGVSDGSVTTPASATWTITGTNDAPVVSGTVTGTATEDGAVSALNALANANDVDAGAALSVVLSSPLPAGVTYNATSKMFSLDPSAAAYQSLKAGATTTVTVSYGVTDGTATVPAIASWVVTGTNDLAVITQAGVRDVTEDASATTLTATGTISVVDADQGEAALQAGVTPAAGNLGSLSLASNGSYTYSVDNSLTQSLGPNAIKTDTFTVTSIDGTTKQITFDIHGVADKPVLTLSPTSGNADQSIPLSISVAPLIDNGAVAGPVEIKGVPSDYFKLSAGFLADEGGSWFVPVDQLSGLALIPKGQVPAVDFSLTVIASSISGANVVTSSGVISVDVQPGAVTQTSGKLVDGYIAGATVFADANDNGILDTGEAFTTTAANGSFTLVGGSGSLVSIGGTDVSTGVQFQGSLKAPAGSTVITPLTTLIVEIIAAAASQPVPVVVTAAEASSQIANAFGFGNAGIDLTTFDPVPTAVDGDATATAVLSAAIQVQSTVAQIAAVGGDSDAVFSSIASAVSAAAAEPTPTIVDLAASSTISDIVSDAGVTGQAASVVANTVAAANTTIQDAGNVTELAQAGQVAQGAAAEQLEALATAIANNEDTTALTNQINADYVTNIADTVQEAEVGDVDGAQLGTLGNDTLTGGGGNDSIDGLDGSDIINGGAGNDLLFGGAGRDFLTGGLDNDILDGGSNFDRAVYTDATGGVTINLGLGTAFGGGIGNDTLVNIEAARGSQFADTYISTGFTGSSGIAGSPIGFNEFEGMGGDDTIVGYVNPLGQAQTRAAYVNATGSVTVDLQAGTASGDASVGNDTLTNVNVVFASNFDDTIRGSNNGAFTYEAFEGRAGNDLIDGRGGFDRADYITDAATTSGITVNMASGTVTGDSTVGTDTLRSVEAVRGTNFDDVYVATGFGLAGALNPAVNNVGSNGTFNEFGGSGGNDTITGNGFTRLAFNNATAGIDVDINLGKATGDVSVGTDTFTGVNAIAATVFNDTLRGSAINENFQGNAGDDFIDGRGGFDTAVYNNFSYNTGGITVNMAAGTVTGDSSIGTDTLRQVEGIQATYFDDTYNAQNFGAAGFLDGNLNNVGNNGNFNQFEGLAGNDVITGNGNTRILYGNAAGPVNVNLATGIATGDVTTVGTDTITGGVNSVSGSVSGDTIVGNSQTNILIGAGGSDSIDGGGGGDMAIFTGARADYTIALNTPALGQVRVTDNVAGRDGADTLTNVEVVQFSNASVLIASGSLANPIDLTSNTLPFGAPTNPFSSITGTDDFITISQAFSSRPIDLGAGTNDTVNLGPSGGYNLNLTGVEFVNGTTGGDFVTLANLANGLSVNLGGGSDNLNLAGGANTLAVTNVENIFSADTASGLSNDTLTLTSNISGVTVFLGNGTNSLNLTASGANSLNGVVGAQTLNTSSGDDSLTILGNVGNMTINLGAGSGDTLTLVSGSGNLTVRGAETVIGSGNFDHLIIDSAGGSSMITAGLGSDIVELGAGQDSLRYTSTADSYLGGRDTINNFDAATDRFVFDGGAAFHGPINYIGTANFSGTPGTPAPQARLETFGGQTVLQIDVNGDGQFDAADMDMTLNGLVGTLSNANFEVIAPPNFAPTDISLSANSIAENSANGAVVGMLSAVDPENGALTFSLADNAGGRFAVSGNTLVVAGALDFEGATSHNVTVRVTDAGGLTYDETFVVNVTDVNETPTNILLSGTTVAENSANGTVVGALSASDPDANGASNFTLLDDAGGRFGISGGNLVVTGALNFEAAASHDVTVRVTDAGGLSYDKTFTVNVGNVNETPTNILLSGATVAENSANGTVVGSLSAIDPDASDTATFSLQDNAGGRFAIAGGNLVVNGAIDYETAPSHQVTVRVTDAGNNTYDKQFTIGVTNVFEGVTLTGDGNPNTLTGTADDDSLSGLGGNDILQGGGGNDLLNGGDGFDRAVFTDATAGVTITLASGSVTGAGIGTDTLVGIEGAIGTNNIDTFDARNFTGVTNLAGTPTGFNDFEGKGGNDTIYALVNSQGATLTRVSYLSATAGVTANLATGQATGDSSVGTDTFIGQVGTLIGSAFADNFTGSANGAGTVEVFDGRGGNDFFDGGAGFDRADYNNDPAVTAAITVNLAAGTVTSADTVNIGTDTLRSIEAVRGTRFDDTYNAAGFTTTATVPNPNAGSSGANGTGAAFNEFTGGGGFDTITGNGNTRLNYNNATAGVTVNLQANTTAGTGTATGNASVDTDTFSGVNAVMSSFFDDTLNGSSANDTFTPLAGDDFIDGKGAFDTVSYNNIYFVTSGVNVNFTTGTVIAAVNGDTSIGTDTLRNIEALQGTHLADTFVATGFGAVGLNPATNNVSTSNGSFNQFEGLAGNDSITGNGNTRLHYGSATAGVTINLQAGTVVGGDASVGTDTFVGVNSVNGSNSVDTYDATGFTGTTSAGSFGSFNLFEGLGGADIIIGNGNTRVSYSQSGSGVTVNLATGAVTGGAGADVITVGTVNGIQGSNFADTLTGDDNNNFIDGGSGDDTLNGAGGVDNLLGGVGIDTLNGGDGNDTMTGGAGNDTINGGAGVDVAIYSGPSGNYTFNATQVVNTGNANGDNTDTLSGVEILQFNNASFLLVSGSALAPIDVSGVSLGAGTFNGTAVDDFITGGISLSGRLIDLGAGTGDTINLFGTPSYNLNLANVENVNGTAADEFLNLTSEANGLAINLGSGADTLLLNATTNTLSVVDVETIQSTDFGAMITHDTLTFQTNVSGVSLNLGKGNNVVNLSGGTNSLSTLFSNMTVNSAGSADTLSVGQQFGSVTYDLGGGSDSLSFGGPVGNATVINVENVNGSAGGDFITIANTSGSTTITGGGGGDNLTAGAGQDNFRFTSTADSAFGGMQDTVLNFDASTDSFVFAQIPGFTAALDYVGTDAFTGTAGDPHSQARLETFGGQTTLQVDVDGDGLMGAGDMAISLQNLQGTLSQSNFMLIV
ncbi:MAG: hypothetical protein A4S14_12520 [Proteobacteria bacterium SG_bin9]|nr:MAG: hypothetical protein A4S14_12520 [Proteobacteria bacterium SG_bin9]